MCSHIVEIVFNAMNRIVSFVLHVHGTPAYDRFGQKGNDDGVDVDRKASKNGTRGVPKTSGHHLQMFNAYGAGEEWDEGALKTGHIHPNIIR